MKITKTPSWLIIVLCLLIGSFASFKAKQQLEKLETQIWLDAAETVNSDFSAQISANFAEKTKLIRDFTAVALTQSQSNEQQDILNHYAQTYIQTHPDIDEISLGFYLIDSNRLSHQWSFGSARIFQQNEKFKNELVSLYRAVVQKPDSLIYQTINNQDNSNPNLLAGLYLTYQNQEYFICSIIDLNIMQAEIDKLIAPPDLSVTLAFTQQQKKLLEWQFNGANKNPDNLALAGLQTGPWQISSQVLPSFKQGPNLKKSQNIFFAGLILTALIGCFIAFLAYLRFTAQQNLKVTELALLEANDQLNTSNENLKRSAKLSVYSQLAPKTMKVIPPYVSNVIKACSSLEEKGIYLKNLIKDKKATKTQYVTFLDNTVLLARGSAESMLKVGESLYNLDRIKQELEQDSLRRVHLQSHIQELVDTYKSAHPDINFIVTISQDLFIESYPGSLTHLLTIFINNSLEHAFKERTDKVLMIEGTFNKKKDRVSIRIEDNGKGLEPELLEAINTQTPHPLLAGIGLSMAKEIIETQLFGEFELKSKFERYTRISILLPKVSSAQSATTSPEQNKAEQAAE